MQFNQLVNGIQHLHQELQQQVAHAVNISLTVRNWLVGYYIVEYEQKGAERAKYGDKLLKELAKALKIKGFSKTSLEYFRRFYLYYPQIYQTLNEEIKTLSITPTVSGQFNPAIISSIYETVYRNFNKNNQTLLKLLYNHFRELIKLDDPLKRQFYEIECMRDTWSVRELRRQISS